MKPLGRCIEARSASEESVFTPRLRVGLLSFSPVNSVFFASGLFWSSSVRVKQRYHSPKRLSNLLAARGHPRPLGPGQVAIEPIGRDRRSRSRRTAVSYHVPIVFKDASNVHWESRFSPLVSVYAHADALGNRRINPHFEAMERLSTPLPAAIRRTCQGTGGAAFPEARMDHRSSEKECSLCDPNPEGSKPLAGGKRSATTG